MPYWSQITDNLYVGNIFAITDKTLFETFKITHVISLVPNGPLKRLYPHVNIIEHFFEDIETVNIIEHGEELYPMMNNIISLGGKILVHCNAGKSRSVGIVIYYLINKYNMKPSEAYEYVKKYKSEIALNSGFEKQLLSL
jgi:atypical dual specificity phosphatase